MKGYANSYSLRLCKRFGILEAKSNTTELC